MFVTLSPAGTLRCVFRKWSAIAKAIAVPKTSSFFDRPSTPVLISLGNRVALIHPVRAEIVGDIEHLHVGKTQRAQGVVGRLDGRAMAPWATSAIDHDELSFGQSLHPLPQLLQPVLVGSRADVLGAGNMRLRSEEHT